MGQRGYVLITFMLMLTLMAIAAIAVLPEIAQQMRRDREEETIHRAVQYSRAIRRYYKKLGRYPTRVEELENTNNIRFLRKRYKDPITGQDFKLLRMGDPQLTALGIGLGMGMPGQGLPGLPGGAPGGGPGNRNLQQQVIQQAAQMGVFAPPQSQVNLNPGGDSEKPDEGSGNPNAAGSQSGNAGSSPNAGQPQPLGSGQVFGGGPILGVASSSKLKTIREFNNKNHYNDWLFIYDPNSDRGGLLNTPYQQNLNQSFGGTLGQSGSGTNTSPNAGPRQGGTPQPQGPPNPPDMPPEQ